MEVSHGFVTIQLFTMRHLLDLYSITPQQKSKGGKTVRCQWSVVSGKEQRTTDDGQRTVLLFHLFVGGVAQVTVAGHFVPLVAEVGGKALQR
jgi:hypothetical protein